MTRARMRWKLLRTLFGTRWFHRRLMLDIKANYDFNEISTDWYSYGLQTCVLSYLTLSMCRKRQKVIPLVEAYLCDCPIEHIAYPVEYKNV